MIAYEMTVLHEVVYIAPVPAVIAAPALAALQHLRHRISFAVIAAFVPLVEYFAPARAVLTKCLQVAAQSGVQHVESATKRSANSESGLPTCPRDCEPSNHRSQPCPTLSTSSGRRASTPGSSLWRCSLPMRIHLSTRLVRRNASSG